MAYAIGTVQQATWRQNRRTWSIVIAGTVLAAGFGVVAAKLAGPAALVIFPVLLVPLALWRWPRASLIALLAGTTLIDQFRYTIGPTTPGGVTSKGFVNVPLFRSLTKGSFVTPAEMLLFVLLIIWLMKGAQERCWHVPRSPLAKSIGAMYLVATIVGLGLGVVHHGQMKVALWELRPWYYLGVVYLLTASFFAGRNVLRPLLWVLILGSGLKSIEGVYNYFAFARSMTPRPEAILGHEESFFFGLFLVTTAALWLFQVRGRPRTVATALAPFVLIADLGNSRRTAALLLYAGLAALGVIALVALPERRQVLKRLNVVVAIGAVVYLGLFWNSGGTLGQPARAVHSVVAPDARDLSSNQYRVLENANLERGIHSTRSIGKGFGVPINYTYAPIVDLTSVDSMIAFIPHNGVLYVWYRLGLLGEIILWSVVGFGILAGCRLAKHKDRAAAVLGVIAVCAIICYVLQGYNDLGFSWVRIVIFMGFVLGALEATVQRAGHPPPRVKAAVAAPGVLDEPVPIDLTKATDEVPAYASGNRA